MNVAQASLARTLASHRRTRRLVLFTPVVLGAVVLLVWEAVSRAGLVSPFFLPAPTAVAARLWAGLTTGELLGYTWVTLVEALLGSALGAPSPSPWATSSHATGGPPRACSPTSPPPRPCPPWRW